MAYNASSKNIPIVKFSQPESVKTAITAQGLNKPEKLYTADVLKSFIKDLSTLLSESNFEYKKILLDEFYTLLKNYKVVTTDDTTNISTDIIDYIKTNITTALDNILTILNSSNSSNANSSSDNSELITVIEQGFDKLKNSNDSSDLVTQFNLLNSKTNEIYNSIINSDINAKENVSTIKNIEDLLKTYIKNNEISPGSNDILPTIKKYLIDSSNGIVNRIKQSNKSLLSNYITKFEKITVNKSKTLYTNRKISDDLKSPTLKQALDKQFYIKNKGNALEDFGNKINRGILANLYTAIKNRRKETKTSKVQTLNKNHTNGKSSKTLTSNILKGVTTVIGGTVGKLTSKIMPFIKIGMTVFKKLAGGWLTWILVFLKNPLVITAIAFIAAFINVKIVRPIKKFWNTFIKPVIDKIIEIYNQIIDVLSPVIDSIKSIVSKIIDFFGNIIDYGIGAALKILWEDLKVEIPILFEATLLSVSIVWNKYVYPWVLQGWNWVLKWVWEPIKSYYFRWVHAPVLKAYNSFMQWIYDKMGALLLGISAIPFLSDDTERNLKNKASEMQGESTQFMVNAIKADNADKNLRAVYDGEKWDENKQEYVKLDLTKKSDQEYLKRAKQQLADITSIKFYSDDDYDAELEQKLKANDERIQELEEEKKQFAAKAEEERKKIEPLKEQIRQEALARKKAEAEAEAAKKALEKLNTPQPVNNTPLLSDVVNNRNTVIENNVKTETTNIVNQNTKTAQDSSDAANNSKELLNKVDTLINNSNSNNSTSPTSNTTIIMQNQNDNKPSPSYNGGSLWQSQH